MFYYILSTSWCLPSNLRDTERVSRNLIIGSDSECVKTVHKQTDTARRLTRVHVCTSTLIRAWIGTSSPKTALSGRGAAEKQETRTTLKNKRPTWCHLLFYFTSHVLQHVSDINISIIRSLRIRCWITTSVVLFLFRCVLEILCGWVLVVSVLQAEAQHGYYSNATAPNLQHTAKQEQNDQCGNSTA